MTDPQNSVNPTTTCLIRTASTPCVFHGDGERDGGRHVHMDRQLHVRQHAVHPHPERRQPELHDSRRPAAGPGPQSGGTETALSVTLTVTDANGTHHRHVGIGRPTATDHHVLYVLIDAGSFWKGGHRGRPFRAAVARARHRVMLIRACQPKLERCDGPPSLELIYASFGGHEIRAKWSGRRGSNPRHRAWEARVLPLNYSRSAQRIVHVIRE